MYACICTCYTFTPYLPVISPLWRRTSIYRDSWLIRTSIKKTCVVYIRFLFMRFDRNVSETLAAAVAGRPVYPPHTDGIIIIIKNERTTIKTLRSINRPRRRNHPGRVCVRVRSYSGALRPGRRVIGREKKKSKEKGSFWKRDHI